MRKVVSEAKSTTVSGICAQSDKADFSHLESAYDPIQLPETLVAVDTYTAHQAELRKLAQARAPTRVQSSASVASSIRSPRPAQRLKYHAYEAPPPATSPKPSPSRARRPSRTQSAAARAESSARRVTESQLDEDPPAQTLSPGRLALAVGDGDLKKLVRSPQQSPAQGLLSPEAAVRRGSNVQPVYEI